MAKADRQAAKADRQAAKADRQAAKDARQAAEAAQPSMFLKELRKQLSLLRRTLDLVLEERYAERFADLAAPNPYRSVHDDNREQLLSLLRRLGVGSRTFLDIGCGRTGGQSYFLARRLGWTGTFVDASPAVGELRARLAHLPDVHVRELMVTPENVNELAPEAGELDLLNIDIDSYDYWVWQALRASPRLVVIEYNAMLGHQPVVVPYGTIREDSPKGYSGASLAALELLGRQKGYRLLGCDHMGVNAYFGRADLLPAEAGLTAEQAWRPILDRFTSDDVPRAIPEWIEKGELVFAAV
jgi:hypothetical protein